jgi:hypothetical protein
LLAFAKICAVGATFHTKPTFGTNEKKSTESDWFAVDHEPIANLAHRVLRAPAEHAP